MSTHSLPVRLLLCFASATACMPSGHPAPATNRETGLPLVVMTFNIRYAHTQPPNLWPDRLPAVLDVIRKASPDIIGTQEGLYHQLRDLEDSLPAYRWIGLGRDGGSRGEYMAVYYHASRLEPLEYDHYWLSETPAVPGSLTWGNRYPRMVTSVRFRDLETGSDLLLVNTHLDHEVQVSRERSAALILERLAGIPDSVPIILTGDFNVPAGGNPVYSTLTGPGGFRDSWRSPQAADTLGTFHGFEGVAAARGKGRIDWILLRGPIEAISSGIITAAPGGQLPSDHFPVVARIRVN